MGGAPGTPEHPLRVAIIGAGPAGFYAADHLLKQDGIAVSVDIFDRLLSPYGLVRHGVAPDHLKIKTVTRAFEQTARNANCRFIGNVEFGRDLTLEDLRQHYHQVLFSTGAQTDRQMGIPGEDLRGSHPATAFVAWYNGHPDYCAATFDLSQEAAVIVGVGNVAIDVARILCLTPDELHATDMPDYAVRALGQSKVRDVYLLGRRGPAQAAFTNPEIKELGELAEADVLVRPEEATLDALSEAELQASGDRMLAKKIELIQAYAARAAAGRPRRLHLRFLVSPEELLDDGNGRVAAVRIVRNELTKSASGALSATPTGETETIPAGLVFRSVGYRGVPLPEVPFHERWGVIANAGGRVIDVDSGEPIVGEYVAGWIKRGPSGVIGTNKPDALETVTAMLEDAAAGRIWSPGESTREGLFGDLRAHGVRYSTFEDWAAIDAAELAEGERCGRPRVKFGSRPEMLACLVRQDGRAAG
jgi:ferredoxin--NADP+ reductase